MTVREGGVQPLLDGTSSAEVIVNEGDSLDVSGRLVDTQGEPLGKSAVSTFTLTLKDAKTLSVINGRNDDDILASVDQSGAFVVQLDAADNPIVDAALSALDMEKHLLILKWTWSAGGRSGSVVLSYYVMKMP